MSSRKTSSAQADLVLLPSLRNCFLNLPSALVAVLLNSNTIAQNVVVELTYRQQQPQPLQDASAKGQQRASSVQKSAFMGWTGMQSQGKLASVVGSGRDGRGGEGKEVPTVEVDATFARLVGLSEGMKVRIRN